MSDNELKIEIAELRQKLLTHELTTGILMMNVIRLLNQVSPNKNASEILLQLLQEGQEKIKDTDARNDHHTKDAFSKSISIVQSALKLQ